MIYSALVKRIDPLIEEAVTIEIRDTEFTGFASVCPYKIKAGESYSVLIGFTILDDLKICETSEDKKIKRIDSGFEHRITGVLYEDTIDAGVVFTDEDEYFSDYTELIGKNVTMKVDRISIEFLKTPPPL